MNITVKRGHIVVCKSNLVSMLIECANVAWVGNDVSISWTDGERRLHQLTVPRCDVLSFVPVS